MSIFKEIVAEVRQSIVNGNLKVGDGLPSVRAMAGRWGCAPGTVQRAYRELALQGLASSEVGRGTRVASAAIAHTTLRQATLAHQVEAFLLETMAAGYSPVEAEEAMREALARWQARFAEPEQPPHRLLRFVGSHDPAIALIQSRFAQLAPDHELTVTYVSSMGGLIALARQGADIAGCHLWDAETGSYNEPYIKRLLPGRRVATLTLAHRCLGLIVRPDNPLGIFSLADLARPGVRFVNRQAGAGARLWLDAHLREAGLEPANIQGYDLEVATHLAVAGVVADGLADAGLGVQAAALAQGVDFVLLTIERYDLVMTAEVWELPVVRALAGWLDSPAAREAIAALGGYNVAEAGRVAWVNDAAGDGHPGGP